MSLQPVQYHTLLRTIATARIVLPATIIRLAAGRQTLDESKQAMCFMAGANAVFTGEQMLTTPCTCLFALFVSQLERAGTTCSGKGDRLLIHCTLGSPWDEDKAMMSRWGLDGMRSFEQAGVAQKEGARLSETAPTVAENARPAMPNVAQ